jgi:F-type H+-transporting ATPase subunit epsilon
MAISASLIVKIVTPAGVIWEGTAESVSSHNSSGDFDVLPDHANMVTLIEKEPIILLTAGKEQRFEFEKAVLSVRDNRVAVYADISSDAVDSAEVSV